MISPGCLVRPDGPIPRFQKQPDWQQGLAIAHKPVGSPAHVTVLPINNATIYYGTKEYKVHNTAALAERVAKATGIKQFTYKRGPMITLLLTALSCSAKDPAALTEHLVRLERLEPDGSWSFLASGTYVEPKGIDLPYAVVTAELVPQNELSVRACGWLDDTMVCAVVQSVYHRAQSDVVLLEIDEPIAVPARLSRRPLYYTEEVVGIGLPLGALVIWRGQVVMMDSGWWGITGGHCDHGISGGPVFDKHGRLAGVFQAMPAYETGFGPDIPVHSICLCKLVAVK